MNPPPAQEATEESPQSLAQQLAGQLLQENAASSTEPHRQFEQPLQPLLNINRPPSSPPQYEDSAPHPHAG
jgi:hypothetical protein